MPSPRSVQAFQLLTALVMASLCAFGQAQSDPPAPAGASSSPPVKYLDIDGARLPYVEQGSGPPVVFIHGSLSDHRVWAPHLPTVASGGFRAVAYTQRYAGTEPWSDKWPPYSSQLHTSDLASFLRALNAGPAHLVTWSYSGHLAFSVALDHPDLVKSIFAFEPSASTYVTDPQARKTVDDSLSVMLTPAAQALKEGNEAEAAGRMIEGVAGQGAGFFSKGPKVSQDRVLDNARTLPLLFNEPPARPINCSQLSGIKTPVAVVQGGGTTPYYRVIAETAARCMPAAKHIVIPDAGHLWPAANSAAFSFTLVEFLKSQGAPR